MAFIPIENNLGINSKDHHSTKVLIQKMMIPYSLSIIE